MKTTHQIAAKNTKKAGQGMTEYIILIVLVAIAVLGGTKLFGDTLRKKTDESQKRVDSTLDTQVQ